MQIILYCVKEAVIQKYFFVTIGVCQSSTSSATEKGLVGQ